MDQRCLLRVIGDQWFGYRSRISHVGIVARALAPALAVSISISGALAAEAIFPQTSRVGLTPPPGMQLSKSFPGFEDAARHAGIIIAELPAQAFPDLEKNFAPDALKAQGVGFERREDVKLKDGKGFIVVAKQEAGGVAIHKWALIAANADVATIVTIQIPESAQSVYPEAISRAALASTVFRQVPVAERLALLPYAMSDLAGFRVVQTNTEGTALLTDGPKDSTVNVEQPFLIVGISLGATPAAEERDSFARRVLAGTPGIKDMHVVRAEPLRIGGQQGYEILIDGKDDRSTTDVSAVQWLRFGPTGYMRILGIARRDVWATVFPRMRAIRDGIEPR